jgi:toxin ParE1/3/4
MLAMASKLVWTPRARADLLRLYVVIGRQDPIAAERYLDRIQQKVQGLQRHPRSGPRRPDIKPHVRMLVVAPYLILYDTIPDTDEGPLKTIRIVRVIDGRRDISKMP